MNSSLSSEQKKLQKTIIDFARQELNPGITERDRVGEFPHDLWQKCADMRLLALPFPEELGGEGFDFTSTIAVYHALGYGCEDSGLVLALGSQLICGFQILLFGNDDQKKNLLPDLASGKMIYCQGITEPGSGSDTFAMKTIAVKSDDGYILNGSKTMISNGPVADRALIYAVTDPQKAALARVSCLVLEKGMKGFTAGKPMDKMGLHTLHNGELIFNDCLVPPASVLGREGQGVIIFTEAVEWERIIVSAGLLGALDRVLEGSVQYSKERSTFGKPIGEYQAVSHKISSMKMNAYLGELALYKAAAIKDQRRHALTESAVAKLFISESLKQACLDAVQLRGGYGYMSEFGVERDLRDSISATIYSGTSEMLANTLARMAGL